MTLDKQITIGFLIMLAIIVIVSAVCMYSISELKHTRTKFGEDEFSLSEIISAFSEEENESGEGGITGENLVEALQIADNQIGVAYINIFVVASLAILFGGILTIMFPKRVTKPILMLVDATQNVKEGDYSYRVDKIGGTDEVAKLITSFNKMLNQIEIEHNHLEERNAELNEINKVNKKLLDETNNFNNMLEQKIREVTDELEIKHHELLESEKLATIGEIATKIAHEIRNPLSGITVALENLRNRINSDDLRNMTSGIIAEVNRLDKIIHELFQLAIPREINFQDCNPNELISKACDLIHAKAETKSIVLEKDLSVLHEPISLDCEQIEQVLLNLMLNAIESIDGPGGKIKIKSYIAEGNLTIDIIDNGHGIESPETKKIFEPFYSTKNNGTGLGLSVSHKIVQAHNGVLQVDSKKGEGSTFTIKIPVNSGMKT